MVGAQGGRARGWKDTAPGDDREEGWRKGPRGERARNRVPGAAGTLRGHSRAKNGDRSRGQRDCQQEATSSQTPKSLHVPHDPGEGLAGGEGCTREATPHHACPASSASRTPATRSRSWPGTLPLLGTAAPRGGHSEVLKVCWDRLSAEPAGGPGRASLEEGRGTHFGGVPALGASAGRKHRASGLASRRALRHHCPRPCAWLPLGETPPP